LSGDGRLVLCLGDDKDKGLVGVFHLFDGFRNGP
jgi:hypothetical protein